MTPNTPSDSNLTVAEILHREVQAERELSKKLAAHSGRWVAVRDHEIVADAETLDALLAIIDPEDVEAFFEVQEHGAACFF